MKNVSARTVRAWAVEQGLDNVGKRGRLNPLHAEAFNKAHKGKAKYTPESEAEKRHTEIPGVVSVDSAGRKTTKTVTITTEAARALFPSMQGKRGRLAKGDVALALSALNADAVADKFNKAV